MTAVLFLLALICMLVALSASSQCTLSVGHDAKRWFMATLISGLLAIALLGGGVLSWVLS